MTWAHDRLAAFDLETDGPDPEAAQIVTGTVLLLGGGQDREDRPWLLRVERPIPAEATAIHGVTTEHANEHGMERRTAIEQMTGTLAALMAVGTPVVAFNGAFDFTVLEREAVRVGVPGLTALLGRPIGPVIDPHVIDKRVDKFRKGKRTLGVTCEHYGVDLGNAHDATADALGAARLAYMIAKRYSEIGDMDLAQLHQAQAGWRREQSASFQAFKRKTDPGIVVNGDWPVQGGAS
jgi:DNA polymerase III subunit epsilon